MRTVRQKYDARTILQSLGISEQDSRRLLLAANKLHRWHELECGTERGAIARDCDKGLMWYDNHKWGPYYGRDEETLALNMIRRVMGSHPRLEYYVQGDPRGCSLYILRPGDVPEGAEADSYYSRGIAVYKE